MIHSNANHSCSQEKPSWHRGVPDEAALPERNDASAKNALNALAFTAEPSMQALKELFTTEVGLMSAAGLTFMLGMGVFFIRYIIKHVREDEANARKG
ncbi:DUF3149 domain-containing protein [Rhizobacter sp. LjRoot28]|uniref:DUF3149 domain-containing protein n=1 Tax=Rhizobacter sp. LjRoot28 TaxID=3342309 RepID=UPI003F4FAB83